MTVTVAEQVDPDTVVGALTGLVTPSDLLEAVANARAAADAAEVTVLLLAVEWAHSHPHLPGSSGRPVQWRAPRFGRDADGMLTDGGPDSTRELSPDVAHRVDPQDDETFDFGLPPVEWDAPAAFAAANNVSTARGRVVIRDALTLRHRLPRTWAAVLAGRCPAWKACKVAQAVLGKPADVADYVDRIAAVKAGGIGPVVLQRVIDAAMLALYPEQREAEQLDALDQQFVRLTEGLNHTGIAELMIRGEWTDLADFEAAVSQVAAALAVVVDADPDPHHGPFAELVGATAGVRRARAVGILAHPDDALALLAEAEEIVAARNATPDAPDAPDAPRPRLSLPTRKQIVLHLRLGEAAIRGLDAGCTDDAQRALLAMTVAAWCGRSDSDIAVAPILRATRERCNEEVSGYVPPSWMRELVLDRDHTCVFPHCGIPSRSCDLDHILEWLLGGPTRAANLAPLCRHHHNLKTHGGWDYRPLAEGVYLWTDPHGREYLHTPDGTRPVATHPPPA